MRAVFSKEIIFPLLNDEKIDCFGILPLSFCRITREYLLSRAKINSLTEGSVLMLALPYRREDDEPPNLSQYAIPPDYHAIADEICARIILRLRTLFPTAVFAAFADHSPIDERHAAAAAGLGVLGDHGLLITERYASYVFLAEIITDLPTDAQPGKIAFCPHCGACSAVCPVSLDRTECLSALTQKKGMLTPEEQNAIIAHGSAWGCDRCQEACPYTRRALESGTIFSPIPAFSADRIPHLTAAAVEGMTDDEFSRRAYAWRGREVILRNLRLLEKKEPDQG